MNAIIYARYSWRPDHISESAEQQVEECRKYCDLRGLEVVGEFRDEEVSGGKPFEERPGGGAAYRELLKSRPCALVVSKLDRLSRDTMDFLGLLRRLKPKQIQLHIVSLGGNSINADTVFGEWLLAQLSLVAWLERGLTSERTSAAMRHHQKNGRSVSSNAPYGWRIVPGDDHAGLVEVEEEQVALERIRELARGGHGPGVIARRMAEEGHPPRGKRWHARTVQRILDRLER
jgi:site-specific DNA recombinase